MIAVQNEGFPLAGLLFSPLSLTKLNNYSAKSLALCLITANVALCKAVYYAGGVGYHKQLKNRLPSPQASDYPHLALAKSSVGIGVLNNCMATCDAPSVFFYVVNLAHPFSGGAVIIRAAHTESVGWVGASSEAPESIQSGYANPAQSTTCEIGVSGGGSSNHCMEAAIMATTPTQNHPEFIWRFFSCQQSRYFIVTAHSEREARSQLPDSPCLFAARLPAEGMAKITIPSGLRESLTPSATAVQEARP